MTLKKWAFLGHLTVGPNYNTVVNWAITGLESKTVTSKIVMPDLWRHFSPRLLFLQNLNVQDLIHILRVVIAFFFLNEDDVNCGNTNLNEDMILAV